MIEHALPGYRDYINRRRRRFGAKRLNGLRSRHHSQPPSVLTAEMEARILEKTRQRPPDGSTHWSTRKLARLLAINHNHVANAWRRAGLQPHRFERYMQSDDPDFERKAADVIGLYINPPQHAAVFAVDEKTAIQALDRLDPVLPLSPGRAERHGFEYHRHGTLSLFAALNTQTGEVLGQTVPRHTSDAFVDFLTAVVAGAPRAQEIHVILDNLATHKTQAVRTFLVRQPKVRLHFTPTYFVLAQSNRALVLKNRTRPAGPRNLHVGHGSGASHSPVHPAIQQGGKTHPMELPERRSSNW